MAIRADKLNPIYIEWCDAISSNEWVSIADAITWGDTQDWTIKQVGFILKETKEYILLAAKINPHNGDGIAGTASDLVKIPKTWIRKRINLSKFV